MTLSRRIGALVAVSVVAGGAGLIGGMALGENATTAYPDHYNVEFENDRVRIIRIKYGPGEKTGMHEHGDGVVVNLTNMGVEFTLPDGTKQMDETTAGSATWSAAGSHAAENKSGRAIEALYVELK